MRLKKNEAALGVMTLILIGTTLSTAYYGVKNSQNAQARGTAEENLLDNEKKLQERQDVNDQLKERITSLRAETQQLETERDELSLSLNNYQEMVERGAAKSDQSVSLRIAQRNLQDLQRRSQQNELFVERIHKMLQVTDNDAAIAAFTKLLSGEQLAIDAPGQIARTDAANDNPGDQGGRPTADEVPQLAVVTPPANKTQSQKPSADQTDPGSAAELKQRITELSDMVTKRERLLREQGELIERLKSNGNSARIQTAKPRIEDNSADAGGLTVNQGFRSGSEAMTTRVISSAVEDAAEIYEAFIPVVDNTVPGIEAFDAILQPYSETIILP